MANRPDNKPAGTDRVAFTRPAAERIARVVRQVEGGQRDQGPISFGYRPDVAPSAAKGVRFCSWTADWSYNTTQKITFDPAGNTATAKNVVLGFGAGNGWVARKGTAGWQLIGADLTLQPAFNSTEIQLFGHSTNGARAQWYSITTCATATA